MTGWRWCPGAYGLCASCKKFTTGLWRYFDTPNVHSLSICATCANEHSRKVPDA